MNASLWAGLFSFGLFSRSCTPRRICVRVIDLQAGHGQESAVRYAVRRWRMSRGSSTNTRSLQHARAPLLVLIQDGEAHCTTWINVRMVKSLWECDSGWFRRVRIGKCDCHWQRCTLPNGPFLSRDDARPASQVDLPVGSCDTSNAVANERVID